MPEIEPSGFNARLRLLAAPVLGRLVLAILPMGAAMPAERVPSPRTAHRVGAILKHIPPDAQIAARYAYYR